MSKIIPFPIDEDRRLTLEECAGIVKTRGGTLGLIAGWNEEGNIFIFNFGDMSRKDAFWLSEQIKRHCFQEDIS